jgi:hypothetical protein
MSNPIIAGCMIKNRNDNSAMMKKCKISGINHAIMKLKAVMERLSITSCAMK